MEDAMIMSQFIANKTEPEDGVSHEEIAAAMWGDNDYFETSDEFE